MHLRQPPLLRNCTAYVSIWPSNVGFGHVQQNRNAALFAAAHAQARGVGLCFAFPFSHANRHKNDGGQGSSWDHFLKIEHAFDTLDAVVSDRQFRTVHLGWRKSHVWQNAALAREVERELLTPAAGTVYLLPVDSELQDNCWPMGPVLRSAFDAQPHPKPLRFPYDCYAVAFHIRRGDSLRKNKKARFVGMGYFIAVAELLLQVSAGHRLCFFLFSDAPDASEFEPFVRRWPNQTTLCNDMSAVDTFHHLIKVDPPPPTPTPRTPVSPLCPIPCLHCGELRCQEIKPPPPSARCAGVAPNLHRSPFSPFRSMRL